jgi:hypothetical protein
MNASSQTQAAGLIARLTLGAVMIAHGLLKFLVFTLPGTAAFFSSVGFPGWAAYIVAPLEVIAGIAMVVGFIPVGPRPQRSPWSRALRWFTQAMAGSLPTQMAAGNTRRCSSCSARWSRFWAMEPLH